MKRGSHKPNATRQSPDWDHVSIGEVVNQPRSGTSVVCAEEGPEDGKPGILRLSCVATGKFNPRDLKTPISTEVPRLVEHAKADTILISRSNTPDLVGASAYVPDDYPNSFLPDTLWSLNARDGRLSMRWLSFALQSDALRKKLKGIAHGTSDSMKKIQKGSFLALPLILPPLSEQQRIAEILGTWDEALEKFDALIVAKVRHNRALMQQLLFGKIRVAGFSKRWRVRTIAELVDPVTRVVSKPKGSFMAAGIRSHGKGVFLKPDFEPEDIALEELFEIRTDDLIVNITFAWEGAAAVVPAAANGALVSHRFPTFRVRRSDTDLSFIRHYILTKRFVFDCSLASPGGAGRNRVLSKAAFLAIELNLPDVVEQCAIGAILDTAAAELRLLRDRRAAVDQQKRGLMQKLLTGEVRVSV